MPLSDKQILAINLLVYEGKLKKDVAAQVGVRPGTISEWFLSEEFQNKYDETMRARVKEIASKANEVIFELMGNAKSETVRLNAAKEFVSRAGYDAPTKQEIKAEGIAIKIDYDKE